MIVTESILEQGLSENGAWNKKQLLALGVKTEKKFKLEKGWKRELIGSEVTEQQVQRFLRLKNVHLNMAKVTGANLNIIQVTIVEGLISQAAGHLEAINPQVEVQQVLKADAQEAIAEFQETIGELRRVFE
ncbi:hypothetical protein LCGC14_0400270 [marine sediment metagenome]|uniref:Uncharacterized protein n=1 Tax=marine sediment metagenome TaxID=412755 RepID=A0A0F9TF32_9ZZZZ